MDLLVLTSEKLIQGEASKLNSLFSAGLKTLHFRKPGVEIEEHRALLDQIAPQYYSKVVLHYHHELCGEYGLKGIHLKEKNRILLGNKLANYVNSFQGNGYTVSSAFHNVEAIEKCEIEFDYFLLSPVFDSISKAGYLGKGFNINHVNKKLIGLGGVNANNVQKSIKLGFKGVAVLGSIWNTMDYLASFATMKAACENPVKLEVR